MWYVIALKYINDHQGKYNSSVRKETSKEILILGDPLVILTINASIKTTKPCA